MVFVAVKPQYVSVVLREVKPHLKDTTVVVSIAAGVTLSTLKVCPPRLRCAVALAGGAPLSASPNRTTPLQEAAGDSARLVRVMPNTPCLVGETAAAMCLGGRADDGDAGLVTTLFEAVGKIYRRGARGAALGALADLPARWPGAHAPAILPPRPTCPPPSLPAPPGWPGSHRERRCLPLWRGGPGS